MNPLIFNGQTPNVSVNLARANKAALACLDCLIGIGTVSHAETRRSTMYLWTRDAKAVVREIEEAQTCNEA